MGQHQTMPHCKKCRVWCAKVTTRLDNGHSLGLHALNASRPVVNESKLEQGFVTVRMQRPEVAVTQAHHPIRFLSVSCCMMEGYEGKPLMCFQHTGMADIFQEFR